MKIIKQEKKGNQVILEVEEAYSKLEPQIEKAYVEASKEVKVPGFRQGKTPADILKKYINEEAVIDRAIHFLISDIYPDILENADIKPVDYPNVEIKKLKKNEPIIIEVKIDVYPEIKLGNYKGIKLTKHEVVVADEEVDKTTDYIRKDYAKHINIPENEVALDDEFAKKVSKMQTLQELKSIIKTNIEFEKKHEADQAVRDEVTKKLSGLVEADIPKGMIEREAEAMIHDLEISLKRSKMTLDSYLMAVKKTKEQLKEDVGKNAQIRIKAKLALEEIAKKEKLIVNDDDINKEIEILAQQTGKTSEEYKKEVSSDVVESIKEYILKDKAIDLVISKAKKE